MRYILSLLSVALIGVLGFQLSTVSAVTATKTVSGEVKKSVVSQKVQILKLKRTLTDMQKKMSVLKVQIATIKKQIELKEMSGMSTKILKSRLVTLTDNLAQVEKKIQEIKSQIEKLSSTGTGSVL